MADRARVLIFTGPGKGKTTAALGMVLRCAGRGMKTLVIRFTKAAFSGELAILDVVPGVTVVSGDYGMTPRPDHPDYPAHVAAAQALFTRAVELTPDYDAVILDELCGVVARGMVPESAVVDYLRTLRPGHIAVLTGRGATDGLIAAADTVSLIQVVKHAYQRGRPAQEGVEL